MRFLRYTIFQLMCTATSKKMLARLRICPPEHQCILRLSFLVWLVVSLTVTALGQEAPTTIWQSLGIGADQYSQNPAIKAAAKAKAAKHEICKKKKALEYLANLGCTPEHPEVGPAIIAAMGDPDEPVRYAAVKAALQTAAGCQSREQKKAMRKALGCMEVCHDLKKKIKKKFCDCIDRIFGKAPPKERPCVKKMKECHENVMSHFTGEQNCKDNSKEDCPCGNGHGPCCSPEMREKLQQLAYGRDDNGCFLETSERVRDVATLALQACCACDGQQFRSGFDSRVVRELPLVTDRELPYEGDDQCFTDRPLFTAPPQKNESGQPTPAGQPENLEFPAEQLPPPTPQANQGKPSRQVLRSVLRRPSARPITPVFKRQEDRYARTIDHPWTSNNPATSSTFFSKDATTLERSAEVSFPMAQELMKNSQNRISMESQRSFLEMNPRWATLGSAHSHLPPRNSKQTHKQQATNGMTVMKKPADSTQSKKIPLLKRADPSDPTGHEKINSDIAVIPQRVDTSQTIKAFQRAPSRVTWLRIPAILITLALLIEIARVYFIAHNQPHSSEAAGEPEPS